MQVNDKSVTCHPQKRRASPEQSVNDTVTPKHIHAHARTYTRVDLRAGLHKRTQAFTRKRLQVEVGGGSVLLMDCFFSVKNFDFLGHQLAIEWYSVRLTLTSRYVEFSGLNSAETLLNSLFMCGKSWNVRTSDDGGNEVSFPQDILRLDRWATVEVRLSSRQGESERLFSLKWENRSCLPVPGQGALSAHEVESEGRRGSFRDPRSGHDMRSLHARVRVSCVNGTSSSRLITMAKWRQIRRRGAGCAACSASSETEVVVQVRIERPIWQEAAIPLSLYLSKHVDNFYCPEYTVLSSPSSAEKVTLSLSEKVLLGTFSLSFFFFFFLLFPLPFMFRKSTFSWKCRIQKTRTKRCWHSLPQSKKTAFPKRATSCRLLQYPLQSYCCSICLWFV